MRSWQVLTLALALCACGGTEKKQDGPGEPDEGQAGGVVYEVDPGTGRAGLTAEVEGDTEQLWLVVAPDNLAGPMAGAQFVVEVGDGLEVGEPITETPMLLFHKAEGSTHRFLLFSYTGATLNPDEVVVRIPLDAAGLDEATVRVGDVVYSDTDGDGPATEDRTTMLRRAGGEP